MISLLVAMLSASWRLNLFLFVWIGFSSVLASLPVVGKLSGLVSSLVLTTIMAALLHIIEDSAGDLEKIKRKISTELGAYLGRVDKGAVLGAYVGMAINTVVIVVSSFLFFAATTLPVLSFALFSPEKWQQAVGTERTALYVLFMLFLTLYIAFNFFFTASVAMAKGLLTEGFWNGFKEAIRGLTPRYFLLSLKPGLWKPGVTITVVAACTATASVFLALFLGIFGIPVLSTFWGVMGTVLFYANIAYHYQCMRIMGLG